MILYVLLRCCEAPPMYLPLQSQSVCREDVIQRYFHLGFSYAEILVFLSVYHGIQISFTTLKRILRTLRLRRHSQNTDWNFVVYCVEHELSGSGRDLGYRSMQGRLQFVHGLVVPRERIRLILRYLDPVGVQSRQQRRLRRRQYLSKGPNFIYHIDGWDKLKRFGLCVHGCIDGFSRRIMWLEASASNNDPFVVCKYFANCVQQINGLPCLVRADRGTENGNVCAMQQILRTENGDDRRRLQTTFLYGTSPSNQRIEAWWSKFPSLSMRAWIDHFVQLDSVGIIDTSRATDIQCIRFVYLELLREELNTVTTLWNTHHIRPSSNGSTPSGKPDVMFHLPEVYSTQSFLKPVDEESLRILSEILTRELPDCLPIYQEIFQSIFDEKHLHLPKTLNEAAELLVLLLDTIDSETQNL